MEERPLLQAHSSHIPMIGYCRCDWQTMFLKSFAPIGDPYLTWLALLNWWCIYTNICLVVFVFCFFYDRVHLFVWNSAALTCIFKTLRRLINSDSEVRRPEQQPARCTKRALSLSHATVSLHAHFTASSTQAICVHLRAIHCTWHAHLMTLLGSAAVSVF